MNFPFFGDAEGNMLMGKVCAQIVADGNTIWSCPDRDPLAKITYFVIPYLVSSDPVVINHLALALKILVFLLFIAAARRVQRRMEAADPRLPPSSERLRAGITAAIVLLLLALCLNNLPVRLADMEAACCAMIAVGFALVGLDRAVEREEDPVLYVLLTCLFMNLAGLFKLSFFVHQFLLLAALALCLPRDVLRRLALDWRVIAAVLAANVGLAAQLLYVWHHFRAFSLTNPSVVADVATGRVFPIVGMEIFTLPINGAYMLLAPSDFSRVSWWLYKVYYALFTTDPFVYGGVKRPSTIVSRDPGYWAWVYLSMAIFAGLVLASLAYGARAVRFVTLTGLFVLLFMAAYMHVEPRYYIFPKALFGLVALHWALRGVARARAWLRGDPLDRTGPARPYEDDLATWGLLSER